MKRNEKLKKKKFIRRRHENYLSIHVFLSQKNKKKYTHNLCKVWAQLLVLMCQDI